MDVTRTTTLLLDGLHESGNTWAWSEFDRRYRPILMGFLRALGASEVDAADVAQETLLRFLTEYRAGRFDRNRGRLRAWLVTLGRTQLALARRRAAGRREAATDPEAIDTGGCDAPLDPESDRLWEEQRRRAILLEALQRLRADTRTRDQAIEAFELVVLHGVPAGAAGAQLGMSAQEVYQAKSRVTARLRRHIDEVERAYDETIG